MRRLFANPLGACAPPQAPNKKNIAPAVLAGIIAGGATLVGGAANLVSQANTNNANRDIAADTNETNMQINREQLAAQRAMYFTQARENRALIDQAYERELENRSYNSPQNQKELYLRAGINPLLAGQFGSVGSSHSMNVPVGQAPTTSTPNAIPAQTGAPLQPLNFEGLGMAPQAAVNAYFASKDSERADYALASDITFKHYEHQEKMMDLAIKAKEAGVNEKWVNSQIEDAERNYWLAVDKNAADKEARQAEHVIQDKMASIAQFKAETERSLANSQIKLNNAGVQKIAQECEEIKTRIIEMKNKGMSDMEINAYIASKEKSLAEMAKIEAAKADRRANNTPMNIYQDFVGGLLEPLYGLLSVGAKF